MLYVMSAPVFRLTAGDQWHCLWGHPECEQQALIDLNWSNKSIDFSSREQCVLLRLITSFIGLFSCVIRELGLLQGVSQHQNVPVSLSIEVKTTTLLYMLPDHPPTQTQTQAHKHISEAPDTHTHTHPQGSAAAQEPQSTRLYLRIQLCCFREDHKQSDTTHRAGLKE